MIKRIRTSPEKLGKLLNLPEGVEIAAVRQGEFGGIEITVADPNDVLPEEGRYENGSWVACESKGSTRGARVE